jgi:hypothetical protein
MCSFVHSAPSIGPECNVLGFAKLPAATENCTLTQHPKGKADADTAADRT